jgi:hypothetical protein
MRLPKFVKDILTDDTGVNFTPDQVGMVSVIVGFHVLSFIAVFHNKQAFDPVAYGSGAAVILGGGGASMWLSSRQKPTPPEGSEAVK